jgi:hypothetical protein
VDVDCLLKTNVSELVMYEDDGSGYANVRYVPG